MRFWNLAGILPLILIFASAALRAQETKEPKGASVSGTVINSITREPVRRAAVTLTAEPSGARQVQNRTGPAPGAGASAARAPKSAPRTIITGADGAFRFENVAEGTYRISIRGQKMVDGLPAQGMSPYQIRVRAGEPVSGLRYSLIPQAVISGRVVDDEGEPLQGVKVVALRRAPPWERAPYQQAGPSSQTDDRGEYRLRNLRPGRYLIQATPAARGALETAENERTALVSAFYPDAGTPQEAVPVSVDAGQEASNVDIRLRRTPVRRVSGRVLLENGQPAERFTVMKIGRDAALESTLSEHVQIGREPGVFVLESVPPGSYTLIARLLDNPNPIVRQTAVAEINVGDSDVEGVELRLHPPSILRGQLRVEGPGAEEARSQLRSIYISLLPVPSGMSWFQVSVREDGSFETSVPGPGRYRFSLFVGTPMQLYLASVRTSSGADVTREIDLSSGAPESVIITMRTDAARITAHRAPADQEDEPCNPYYATAVPVSADGPPDRGPVAAPVDDSGQAVLFPVPPGEYAIFGVCAPDPAFIYDPDLLESLLQKAEKIRVQAGEQKTVKLKDAAPPAP